MSEEDILKSELGFYLHKIGEASDEERPLIEQKYKQRINTILNRLSEMKSNG